MKARAVDTVCTNEEQVRLMIYDGVIPLHEAANEIVRIVEAQLSAEQAWHARTRGRLFDALQELKAKD
jgi:hypothetical protein